MFLVSSILPKKTNEKIRLYMPPQVELFSFVFWENWRHTKRYFEMTFKIIWFKLWVISSTFQVCFWKKYILNCIKNSGLKSRFLYGLRFFVFLDLQANLPEISPFVICPNGCSKQHLFSVYSTCDVLPIYCMLFKEKILEWWRSSGAKKKREK